VAQTRDESRRETEARTVPVLPLTTGVVLPQMVVTVALETDEARAAADALGALDRDPKPELLLVPRVEGRYGRIGVLATVESHGELPGGTPALIVRATGRARIGAGVVGTGTALLVEADPIPEPDPSARAVELADELRSVTRSLFEQLGGRRLTAVLDEVDGPSGLADLAGWWPDLAIERKVELLETVDVEARVELVLAWVRDALAEAEVARSIRSQVEEGMEARQREFLLRQQLDAIRKELGEGGDDEDLAATFRARLAELELTDAARAHAEREIDRLERMSPQNAEYGWVRTWLETFTELPWGTRTTDQLDLAAAKDVLDADHTGLDEVKDRIVEFLAVGAMRGEMAGSILLLIGPPGVGKTSIGKSIAEALGRKFYRFSVGGMRDEAEIKGHRRTYIGAMPGKFVQALKEAGSANPVIMLDEIDKIGASFQGDPASALLEVLDPEQNADFLDHYLDVRFDLSKALFICTANDFSIPSALLDRMEVIRLSGYITEEKLAIARHHLWPRVLERAGLKKNQLTITEGAIRHVIEGYAREAGVRNLEKQLGRVARKAVVKILGGAATPIRIGTKEIEAYLDKPVFTREKPITGVGVVTGLAWTALGGATLPVEATRVHTLNRGFKLTGKLGEVMKESAEIAYSYVASHLKAYGADETFFDKSFVHLHVPEGATPKDGPSAGVTMATALLSLAKNKKLPRPLAMTGELTLTGQVLPVGGIREKVIAARRIGLHELILPEANRRDFDKLPGHIRAGMTVHFAKRYQDVAGVVFG
jgi:ATP-dependent Lon protease